MKNEINEVYAEIQKIQEELTEKSFCIINPVAYYSSNEEQNRFSQEDRLNYIKLEKYLKELQTKLKVIASSEEIIYQEEKTLIKNIPYIQLEIKEENEDNENDEDEDEDDEDSGYETEPFIVEPERLVMFQPKCQICQTLGKDGIFMNEVDHFYKIGFMFCNNEYCQKIAEDSRKAYLHKNQIIEIKSIFPDDNNGRQQVLPIIVPRTQLNDDGTPVLEEWFIDTNVNIIKINNEYNIVCISSLSKDPYIYKYINISKLKNYNKNNEHLQKIIEFIDKKILPINNK